MSKKINESRIKYPESIKERIGSKLVEDLKNRTTSLGDHPIFPESDEMHFEEKIIGKRFEEVVNRVKRHFDFEDVNERFLMENMFSMVNDCIRLESNNKKQLVELAIKAIREEYDMTEDDVNIIAELTTNINMGGTIKNPTPTTIDEMEFDDHKSIANANAEVYKRRFVNSMIQGSAKKSTHMFNMMEDELTAIDSRLMNKYGKMMSAADYMYFMNIDLSNSVAGGISKVIFPKNEGEKPTIAVQALTFPVLIHELVKGVMELLSSHGLPKDNKLKKYVIGKSDYLQAEPWDMRIGPGIWGKFMESIEPDDIKLKHHIYSELVALPVNEFNSTMREIMAGTKSGKAIIKDIVSEIKSDMRRDEFELAMAEQRNSFKNLIDNPDELDDIDLSDFK